jgi:hypothetical protein
VVTRSNKLKGMLAGSAAVVFAFWVFWFGILPPPTEDARFVLCSVKISYYSILTSNRSSDGTLLFKSCTINQGFDGSRRYQIDSRELSPLVASRMNEASLSGVIQYVSIFILAFIFGYKITLKRLKNGQLE